MMEEVGTYPHNLSNSSPVVWGDLIFVSTSNGQDESHVNIPSPRAPSIIARQQEHRQAGVGGQLGRGPDPPRPVVDARRSARSAASLQVVSAQGDGWVRGYEAQTGKKLWEFDTNPKDSVWPRTRNEVIATPVIFDERVYIANGQDPEHGEGVGHFYAIDATKRGDITTTGRDLALRQDPPLDLDRRPSPTAWSTSPTSAASSTASTRRPARSYWTHDMFAAVWGSPFVVDGKVYLGDEDGDVVVLAHGKEKKVLARDEHGQRRLRHGRAGQRHAVPEQPQPAVRARGEMSQSDDQPVAA